MLISNLCETLSEGPYEVVELVDEEGHADDVEIHAEFTAHNITFPHDEHGEEDDHADEEDDHADEEDEHSEEEGDHDEHSEEGHEGHNHAEAEETIQNISSEKQTLEDQLVDAKVTAEDFEYRLELLYKSVSPFLDNLCKNSDKSTIYWPDRVAKIQAYKSKLLTIVEGK